MSDALTPFVPTSIEQAVKLAELLARSLLLPDALRGKPGDVLVTIITGHELGLSPMQAIRGLHVIKGKAVMSSDLTVALVKKHPECVYFKLVDSGDTAAMYETERKGEGKTKMSFTIEQAQRAGLTNGDNWRKYPAAMLRARCASALARAVYPDLTLGVYDPDEIREIGGEEPAPPPPERDVTPPTTGKRVAEVKAQLAAKTAREQTIEATPAPAQEAAPKPAAEPVKPPPPKRMPRIIPDDEPPPPSDADAPPNFR